MKGPLNRGGLKSPMMNLLCSVIMANLYHVANPTSPRADKFWGVLGKVTIYLCLPLSTKKLVVSTLCQQVAQTAHAAQKWRRGQKP